MGQNIYDDPEFHDAYRRLPRSEHGLAGAPEWTAVEALLPPLTGLEVVDLGCGFGAFARWAAAQGATVVDALDGSGRMLDRARELTSADIPVRFAQADLDLVELPASAYDVAYSALVVHYLTDLDRFLATVHAALRPGGTLVLTTEHPIFTAPTDPRWLEDAGRRVWPVDRYGEEGERVRDWLAPGVGKQHRTFGTLVNAVIDAGFTLRKVVDWRPSPGQLLADPGLAEEVDRPMFLLLAAERG